MNGRVLCEHIANFNIEDVCIEEEFVLCCSPKPCVLH